MTLQKAADLFKSQGRTESYRNALNAIKIIQSAS